MVSGSENWDFCEAGCFVYQVIRYADREAHVSILGLGF